MKTMKTINLHRLHRFHFPLQATPFFGVSDKSSSRATSPSCHSLTPGSQPPDPDLIQQWPHLIITK